jgi:hypothetical protein
METAILVVGRSRKISDWIFCYGYLPESSKASPLKEILDFNAKALGKSAQLPSKNLSFWPA